jgi:proteic killer suppression protein
MIQSWNGKEAKAIFEGRALKSVPAELAQKTKRRLDMLHAATAPDDLLSPPSNRLHKLDSGSWSISVNMQYRITFTWGANGPENVWFGDYH